MVPAFLLSGESNALSTLGSMFIFFSLGLVRIHLGFWHIRAMSVRLMGDSLSKHNPLYARLFAKILLLRHYCSKERRRDTLPSIIPEDGPNRQAEMPDSFGAVMGPEPSDRSELPRPSQISIQVDDWQTQESEEGRVEGQVEGKANSRSTDEY